MTTRFYEYIRDGVPSGAAFRYQLLDSGGGVLATELPDLTNTPSDGWVADTASDEFGSDQYFPSVRFFNDGVGSPTWNVVTLKVDVDPAGGTSWGELARFQVVEDIGAGDELRINGAALTFGNSPGIPVIIDHGGINTAGLSYRHRLRGGGSVLPGATKTSASYSMNVGAGELSVPFALAFENDTGSEWTGAAQIDCEVQDPSGAWQRIDLGFFSSIDVPNGATLSITDLVHTFEYS